MVSKELHDSELISDSLRSNPRPAWIYLGVIAALGALLWGGAHQTFSKQQRLQAENPFLQVTNRDFSLFLYQFPEYMRIHVSAKAGYLPGFQYSEKIGIEPGQADDYVSAPPEVLFLYHIWKSLLGDVLISREIRAGEFRHFLDYSPEWQSHVANIDQEKAIITGLPVDVQKAFIGWKNFFMEGELINQVNPTYGEMALFLEQYPQYGRNYWQNILMRGKPDYLKSLFLKQYDPDAKIPESEMAAFLKVAYYNFSQK
jgi:hypothetical protein